MMSSAYAGTHWCLVDPGLGELAWREIVDGDDDHLEWSERRSKTLTDLIWSFSPWFVFLFASRFTTFSGAVALGFLTSVVVLTRATTRHRAHMLDWAGLCYFRGAGSHSGHHSSGSHRDLVPLCPVRISYGPHHPRFRVGPGRSAVHRVLCQVDDAKGGLADQGVQKSIDASRWSGAWPSWSATSRWPSPVRWSARQALLRVIVPFGALYFAYHYTEAQRAKVNHDPQG